MKNGIVTCKTENWRYDYDNNILILNGIYFEDRATIIGTSGCTLEILGENVINLDNNDEPFATAFGDETFAFLYGVRQVQKFTGDGKLTISLHKNYTGEYSSMACTVGIDASLSSIDGPDITVNANGYGLKNGEINENAELYTIPNVAIDSGSLTLNTDYVSVYNLIVDVRGGHFKAISTNEKCVVINSNYAAYENQMVKSGDGATRLGSADSSSIAVDYPVSSSTITGINLSVGIDLSLNFLVSLKAGDEGAQLRVMMNGHEHTLYGVLISGNDYSYTYSGISPQCLGDIIKAELVLNGTVVSTKDNISFENYCKEELLKSAFDVNMTTSKFKKWKTLLTDLLLYGADAQNFLGYKTTSLVSNGVSGGTVFVPISSDSHTKVTNQAVTGVGFVSAALRFDSTNCLKFTFSVPDTSKLVVKVAKGGSEKSYTAADFTANGTNYCITTDPIAATSYNDVYTITLTYDGTLVQTLTYSVRDYVYALQNKQENSALTLMAKLARSTYNYGLSAVNFKNAH